MRLRTLSTLLSEALSHLPSAEYERAKCEGLAAQVQEQRAHIEDLARRLECTTRQKDEAEERESSAVKAHDEAEARRLVVARSERDEWKRNCESVQIDREAIKAQYEAEKVAHGETEQCLAAAIAERDEWQLSHGTVAREKEQLKAERDALRARVAELQSGEPVAWMVERKWPDSARFCTIHEANARSFVDGGTTVTPLYTIEKKVNGQWTRWRDAKDREDAQKGVESARRCCPSDEWQVGEYVRVQDSWLDIEIQSSGGGWVALGCVFHDEAEVRADMEADRHMYLNAHRIVRIVRGTAGYVVETFPPRTP